MTLNDFITKYKGQTKGYPTDSDYNGEFYFSQAMLYNSIMPFTKGHLAYKGFLGKTHSKEARKKMSIGHTGKKLSPEHKAKIIARLLGHSVSKETRKKIADAQMGDKHWNWKGENVKYRRLHGWLVLRYGKANHCEHCRRLDAKVYDWANISGEYKRNVSDYIQLCRSCHIAFDDTPEKKIARRKNLEIGWRKHAISR